MKAILVVDLFWIFVFLFLALLAHLSGKFLLQKYNTEMLKIEKLKETYPNKSFLMKENINENLLKSQAKMLLMGRYGFLLFAIIILLRDLFNI